MPTKKVSVRLENLTWVEAESIFREYDIVVIPLGARTKEHGPHLPLNTDYLIAEYLAEKVAAKVPAIIMPTIQYGYYPAFVEYPGSVSLELETFKNVVKEICISISRCGIQKIYILNCGISTLRGLELAAEELKKFGIFLKFTNIQKILEDVEKEVCKQEGGTHADESETSMMLVIKPEVVKMEKAVKDYNPEKGKGMLTRDPNKPGIYSPSGVYGDATLAAKEKGERIVEVMVNKIVAEVETFIKI